MQCTVLLTILHACTLDILGQLMHIGSKVLLRCVVRFCCSSLVVQVYAADNSISAETEYTLPGKDLIVKDRVELSTSMTMQMRNVCGGNHMTHLATSIRAA